MAEFKPFIVLKKAPMARSMYCGSSRIDCRVMQLVEAVAPVTISQSSYQKLDSIQLNTEIILEPFCTSFGANLVLLELGRCK